LNLVRLARRRLLLQEAVEHGAWGAVAGLGGFLLVLVAGSGILDWYWPVLLAGVAAGVSWLRSRRRVPTEYEAARRVDVALDDQDTLATAWHFAAGAPVREPDPRFLDLLEQRAGERVRGVEVGTVLPLRRPRAAIPVMVLAVAAVGLFTVRYGILWTLDLRAPIAQVSFDTLTGAPVSADPGKVPGKSKMPQPEAMLLPEGDRASIEESEQAQEEAFRQFEVAANAGRAGDSADQRKSATAAEGEEGEESSEEGEGSAAGDSDRPPSSNDPRDAKGDNPPPQKAGKDDSLLNKMRDALANLMEKMKVEPQGTDQQQMAANKKAGGQSGEGQKQQSDRGTPTKGQSDSQGDPGDAQGDPDGEPAQAQDSQSPGQKSTDSPSADQKSGVGQQDGRKDSELAEHAEAMGKLTELLGRRSQQVQGEIMVEVTNSRNQQARTPYESRQAARGEGGDSARDEVPLHLQPYIQQFYEQVRKSAPAAAPATKR